VSSAALARWRSIALVHAPCCLLNTIMIIMYVGRLKVAECPECLATFTVLR
jgi:hypothetical protein